MKKPVMYIFANKGLGMSAPKLAAQVAHAAVEAFILSPMADQDAWRMGGHYTKIVLEARDTEHLRNIHGYVEARGFKTAPIIDEGRTEVPPHSFTALGVQIVDKSNGHAQMTFSTFDLYKDEKPEEIGPLPGGGRKSFLERLRDWL